MPSKSECKPFHIGKTTYLLQEHFPEAGHTIDEILVELPKMALQAIP